MKESDIKINGLQATPSMVMTIRVAIESFAMDLNSNGLGDDEHGLKMKGLHLARINEIREQMSKTS